MLRHVLDSALWKVSGVATRRSAIERLGASAVSVIVCESVLDDGTWKDILEYNQAALLCPAAYRHFAPRRRVSLGGSAEPRRV